MIIKDSGYQQVGNTTLFVKDSSYMLSPSVSAGEAGSYWIDMNFLNDFKTKVRIFQIIFMDDRGKNAQALLDLEISTAQEREKKSLKS